MRRSISDLQEKLRKKEEETTLTTSDELGAPTDGAISTEEGECDSVGENDVDALFEDPPEAPEGGEDDFLGEILRQIEPSRKGPNIGEKLAQIIKVRFDDKPLTGEEARAAVEAVQRPGNCEALTTPATNKEVWDSLPAQSKKADNKLATTHKATMAAATEITKAVESLIELRNGGGELKDIQKPVKDIIAALGILGYVGKSISQVRKDQIKPQLKFEYQGICSHDAPGNPEWLFGDELVKRQREVSSANRLVKSMGKSQPEGNFSFRGRPRGGGSTGGGRQSHQHNTRFLAHTPGSRGGPARGRRGQRH